MVLESLAAANAAYAIIRKCVENGSELAKAGKAISDFTLAKDKVEKAARQRGSNLDGSKSDLEEFLALDELKRKEDELRSMMQLYGRANMYPDYVKFCAEARRQRAEAAAEAKRLAIKRQDDILLIIYWAACIGLGVFAICLFIYILMEASNV
jgi:hypothetical protein